MRHSPLLVLLVFAAGCVRQTFGAGEADVPVMLGPVDRIGGAPVQRPNGESTIEVEDSMAAGLNPSPQTFKMVPAISAATRGAGKGPDPNAIVHVNSLRTGTYVFWTIPYLTPVGLWREHWLTLEGEVEKPAPGK